jgi:predicted transcriptional regulator
MSKSLSLKLNDAVFEETEKILKKVKMPRNAYINKALDYFNEYNKRNLLRKQLAIESKLVAAESMRVLHEFEAIDDVDHIVW